MSGEFLLAGAENSLLSSSPTSGRLNIGIYEGDELRLVGTRTIPLAELEPNFLRREIEEALGKQILSFLDPEAVSDFLKHLDDRKRF